MIKNSIYFICFFMCATTLHAQNIFTKDIRGKVSSDDGDVAATHVLNITTQKAAITDIEGYFTIAARLNDTLVFSAIQYKRKEIVITTAILAAKTIFVSLDSAVNELNEVVVMPYNLTGDLSRDMKSEQVVVAATLGLPNAYVKKKTQSERLLIEATTGGGIPLNPIINAITGRTKMLKENYKRDMKYLRTERVRDFYSDSLYISDLKIPALKIDDFMYFCEIDPEFSGIVDTHDKIKILAFLRRKSVVYIKNNEIESN